MKKELDSNSVLEDLNSRNDNWEKLDGVIDQVDALETNKQETQVKISSVEKELNSLKSININSNQEATQVAQGYGVVSLPKTAGEGHADFSMKGLTATNIASKLVSMNEQLVKTETGFKTNGLTTTRYALYDDESVNIGDKIYGKGISENGNLTIRVAPVNSYSGQIVFGEEVDKIISKVNISSTKGLRFMVRNLEQEVDEISDVMFINLTQTFGAGNEPTKEECDVIFSNYFEGTQSTQGAMRVKSVSQDLSKETTQYINAPTLRSLPNGVADEVKDGKFIQRVGEYKLKRADITNVILGNETVVVTTKKEILNSFNYGWDNNGITTDNYPYKKQLQTVWDNETSIGSMVGAITTELWFVVEKNTTLEQAKDLLENEVVRYGLAEPIITPIETTGTLIAYPSGAVYVENVVADAGMYTTKMDILNTDLPIKTLDKLSKVEYTTGLEHSLDISKAVVTAQSFTHPDLTMGDIVFFEYYYDLESTNGNASVEYYDSRYTVKDSVTDRIYKWTIAIANGVPSIEMEEV